VKEWFKRVRNNWTKTTEVQRDRKWYECEQMYWPHTLKPGGSGFNSFLRKGGQSGPPSGTRSG